MTFERQLRLPLGEATGVQVGRAGRQSLMGETPKTALAPQRTGSF
ncbi:hypothetical protein [uncultured Nostoc sp.]|nr:hypothetical protein [uncultured Nostoc sp.]